MPSRYEVRSISTSRLAEAYPLMRAVRKDLRLDDWLHFGARYLNRAAVPPSGPSGIIGIEGLSGYLHGLLVFRVESELQHGRTLKCEHVVVASLIGESEIARCMLDAIDHIARANECLAIQVAIDEPSNALSRYLEDAGLIRDMAVFRKPLPQLRATEIHR